MYTGHDPRLGGEPIDISGGGLDPSAYYHQSPGGRFRGDQQNFLDYIIGVERGNTAPNPDYDVPAWAERLPGLYGRFARFHENNVQRGGTGNAPPYVDPALYLYSGPAARYGPPGGPLHGLLDQERPQPWDGPDGVPTPNDRGTGGKRRGGGGGSGGSFSYQAYGGLNHKPSFVDWQPDNPIGEPTRFIYGESTRQSTPAPRPGPISSKPGGGGGGGGRGPQRGNQVPPSGTGPAGNKPTRPGGPTEQDFLDYLNDIFGGAGATGADDKIARGRDFRAGMGGGVDMNLLDKGTPGWMRDRTLNPNLAGHHTPETVIPPRQGQSFEDYVDSLARQGYDIDTISSLVGPNGYQRSETGDWSWGWGTGPVTRGENGYQFANDGTGQGSGFSLFGETPNNNRNRDGFSLFDRRPGAEARQGMSAGAGGLMDLILGGHQFAR